MKVVEVWCWDCAGNEFSFVGCNTFLRHITIDFSLTMYKSKFNNFVWWKIFKVNMIPSPYSMLHQDVNTGKENISIKIAFPNKAVK